MTKNEHLAYHYTRIMQGWGRHLSPQDGEDAAQDAAERALRYKRYNPSLDPNGSVLASLVERRLGLYARQRQWRSRAMHRQPVTTTIDCPVCGAEGQHDGTCCTRCHIGLPKGAIHAHESRTVQPHASPLVEQPQELDYRLHKYLPILQYLKTHLTTQEYRLLLYHACRWSRERIQATLDLRILQGPHTGDPMYPKLVSHHVQRVKRKASKLIAEFARHCPDSV